MNNLIILIGISGSGKSTWATNFLKENENYLRINRDDIRKTLVGNLNGYYKREGIQKLENIVNSISINIMSKAFIKEYSLILDNTNLKLEYFLDYINNAKIMSYSVQFKLFDIFLITAKTRVFRRDKMINPEENLKYIEKQYQQYQSIKQYILKNYEGQII